ncbi:MAG: prepilin-type N-terminal cleavage/methylation domain-containing protein [Kiritimatiellaeota bacterium]|nr:prepilin-type N-terminal cleavage/methylation domain-containing protein [Kiritimatiellota bacterium]
MRKKGFTLIELLLVILVMSLIVTLSIGAAMKAIIAGRDFRVEAMRDGLELALKDYYAKEGTWPCPLPPDGGNSIFATFDTVEKNIKVFENVIKARNRTSLDPAGFMTVFKGTPKAGDNRVLLGGTRMSLREALEKHPGDDFPLGYPNPRNQSEFVVYWIRFNLMTDSAEVSR